MYTFSPLDNNSCVNNMSNYKFFGLYHIYVYAIPLGSECENQGPKGQNSMCFDVNLINWPKAKLICISGQISIEAGKICQNSDSFTRRLYIKNRRVKPLPRQFL